MTSYGTFGKNDVRREGDRRHSLDVRIGRAQDEPRGTGSAAATPTSLELRVSGAFSLHRRHGAKAVGETNKTQ